MTTPTTGTAKSQPSAAEVYAAHARDVQKLLEILQGHLKEHAATAAANPTSWGPVGGLGSLRDDLVHAMAFLMDMESEAVRDMLAK